MGLANVKERWSQRNKQPLEGLGILELIEELAAKDRIPVDLAKEIVLNRYQVAFEVGETIRREEIILPTESVEVINKVLDSIAKHGFKKGMRLAMPYGHEYLKNPQVMTMLARYAEACKPFKSVDPRRLSPWDEDRYARMRKKIQVNLYVTLIHLAAARLHLFHRKPQWETNHELQEAHDKIDREAFTEVAGNMRDAVSYWS